MGISPRVVVNNGVTIWGSNVNCNFLLGLWEKRGHWFIVNVLRGYCFMVMWVKLSSSGKWIKEILGLILSVDANGGCSI